MLLAGPKNAPGMYPVRLYFELRTTIMRTAAVRLFGW